MTQHEDFTPTHVKGIKEHVPNLSAGVHPSESQILRDLSLKNKKNKVMVSQEGHLRQTSVLGTCLYVLTHTHVPVYIHTHTSNNNKSSYALELKC